MNSTFICKANNYKETFLSIPYQLINIDLSIEQLNMAIILSSKDKDYKESIQLFNGMINHNPETVFVCSDENDVVEGINYARLKSKTISVISTGHNVSGRSLLGDVVISVRNMQKIEVDSENSIARCEPGVTMAILDGATYPKGLVCTGGTISSTGITGLTLGGGVGWLHGNLGTTCDNVKEFEIIDYRGVKLICNDSENQDLFWVMRGAGFGIGVVTKITYALRKIKLFLAYNCIVPFESFQKCMKLYLDITANCSNNSTFFLSFLTGSNGNKVVSLELAFSNFENRDRDEYDQLKNKIQKYLGSDIIKEFSFNSYLLFQCHFDNENKHGLRCYWKTLEKQKISDIDIVQLEKEIYNVPSKQTSILIDHYHGKMCEIPLNECAFNKRRSGYGIVITSQWENSSDDASNITWTADLYDSLKSTGGINYINYLGDSYIDETEADKLFGKEKIPIIRSVIKKYDPNNTFTKPLKFIS